LRGTTQIKREEKTGRRTTKRTGQDEKKSKNNQLKKMCPFFFIIIASKSRGSYLRVHVSINMYQDDEKVVLISIGVFP
jgi:hypothetical protein